MSMPPGGSVTEYDTTGLHPVEFGEVPKSSTNFLRGEAPVILDESSDPAGVPFALFPRSSAERAAACEAEGRWCNPSRGNQSMDSECWDEETLRQYRDARPFLFRGRIKVIRSPVKRKDLGASPSLGATL